MLSPPPFSSPTLRTFPYAPPSPTLVSDTNIVVYETWHREIANTHKHMTKKTVQQNCMPLLPSMVTVQTAHDFHGSEGKSTKCLPGKCSKLVTTAIIPH